MTPDGCPTVNRRRATPHRSSRSVRGTPGRRSTSSPLCCGVAAAASCRRPHRPRCCSASHSCGLAWTMQLTCRTMSTVSSNARSSRSVAALQPAALQAVAAPGGSQGSDADVQQMRRQLNERDAEVQQLRQEVTALKVCERLRRRMTPDFDACNRFWHVQLQASGITPFRCTAGATSAAATEHTTSRSWRPGCNTPNGGCNNLPRQGCKCTSAKHLTLTASNTKRCTTAPI